MYVYNGYVYTIPNFTIIDYCIYNQILCIYSPVAAALFNLSIFSYTIAL